MLVIRSDVAPSRPPHGIHPLGVTAFNVTGRFNSGRRRLDGWWEDTGTAEGHTPRTKNDARRTSPDEKGKTSGKMGGELALKLIKGGREGRERKGLGLGNQKTGTPE
jgi:hypothetical protein